MIFGRKYRYFMQRTEKNAGSGTEFSHLWVQWLIAILLKECKWTLGQSGTYCYRLNVCMLRLNILHMFKVDNWLSVYNGVIFDMLTNFNQPEFTNQSSSIVTNRDISGTFVYSTTKNNRLLTDTKILPSIFKEYYTEKLRFSNTNPIITGVNSFKSVSERVSSSCSIIGNGPVAFA